MENTLSINIGGPKPITQAKYDQLAGIRKLAIRSRKESQLSKLQAKASEVRKVLGLGESVEIEANAAVAALVEAEETTHAHLLKITRRLDTIERSVAPQAKRRSSSEVSSVASSAIPLSHVRHSRLNS